MTHLTRHPIDVAAALAEAADPARGGVVVFLGRVRDNHHGRAVAGLEYSAYEAMAERASAAIVHEAEARWPVRVLLVHRLGALVPGDVAVLVLTSGGHRDEAYEANRWVIDAVKARVPIWKLERFMDGTTAWVDPTAPTPPSP